MAACRRGANSSAVSVSFSKLAFVSCPITEKVLRALTAEKRLLLLIQVNRLEPNYRLGAIDAYSGGNAVTGIDDYELTRG